MTEHHWHSITGALWDCLSQKLGAKLENGYYGMKQPDGTDNWIRTTSQGLIPEKQSSPTASLGTTGWRFANVWSTKYNGKTLLDWMHPVNDVVLRFDKTSPASLWGGTWTQIATGRVLRAANDTNTGGADSVTLTVAQMPSHQHRPGYYDWARHALTAGFDTSVGFATTNKGYATTNANLTTATGGGGSHSNVPAYQNVIVWRRTA